MYIASTVIYNVYIHPLSKYPGPWLNAAFRFPNIYMNCMGVLPPTTKALHEKYGAIVRIAPDELSYTDPEAWKEIYGFRKDKTQLPKDHAVLPLPEDNYTSIIASNDADHARMRRLLSHAFSPKALEDQEGFIGEYVDLLIKRLHEHSEKPQDMMAWFNWTTFDLIGDLAFGEPYVYWWDRAYV